jgi:hypothetical protein
MSDKPLMDGFLSTVLYGHDNPLEGIDDVIPDLHGDGVPDPVEAMFKAAEDVPNKGASVLRDSGWDEPLTARPEKRGTPVTFAKGTLGASLGVVRTERKQIGEEVYNIGYNVQGEEVGSLLVKE